MDLESGIDEELKLKGAEKEEVLLKNHIRANEDTASEREQHIEEENEIQLVGNQGRDSSKLHHSNSQLDSVDNQLNEDCDNTKLVHENLPDADDIQGENP